MPNTIKPFYAARLVDERCQVTLPIYQVDTATHESLLESVEAITKSSRTPDEVQEMLAVVNAQAGELFTEEERASLFKDVTESDGTPLTIKIEAEGNYPLIFEALDQLTSTVTDSNEEVVAEAEETKKNLEAAQTKVTELESSVSEKDGRITELETEVEKLKAEAQDPELVETLKTEIETLKTESASDKETINTLRGELADFESLKHDTLVKEAARLALETKRGIAKGKSFNELCEALAARTDESLNDMISDCKSDLESAEAAPAEEEEEKPEGDSEPVIEQVEDPTLPVIKEGEKPAVEDVAEDLHSTITEDEDSIETYRVMGLSETELKAIYGEDVINKLKDK